MKIKKIVQLILGITFSLASASPMANAAMKDYCVIPPFVVTGIKPNLLLMIDNSASMSDLSYIAAGNDYCYDNSYNDAIEYSGYFARNTWYGSAGTDFITDGVGSSFTQVVVPAAGTCTYQSTYACVTIAPNPVFVAKGNFLNWLSTSKLDVQKLILTGGKYEAGFLVGESRGCVGRSFIKETAGLAGITFGVRGFQPDKQIPSTGGTTRIDIYQGNFDFAKCQAAIDEWSFGNFGTAKQLTEQCMAEVLGGGGGKKEEPPYNHALQTCWTWARGQAISAGDVTRIMQSCEKIYLTQNPETIPSTDKAYVCVKDPNLKDISDAGDPGGYVGICVNPADKKFPINSDACIARELEDFCLGVTVGEVLDPSTGAQDTGNFWNIPAILVDSGVKAQIGDPKRTYQVRISQNTEPKGLIHKFVNILRFGVMAFNSYGSDEECNTPDPHIAYSCVKPEDRDGAKILHYIGMPDPADPKAVNDTAGLISAINRIKAETWTPYSEAFYSAIGYYSQNAGMRINNAGSCDALLLNSRDFCTHTEDADIPDPIQYKCQSNNVLLISDGMSTTDQYHTVRDFVSSSVVPREDTYKSNNDGQVTTSASATKDVVPRFYGSLNLDDLSWYAKHISIIDPTKSDLDPDPANRIPFEKDKINTYVVYTGIPCTDANNDGQCDSQSETVPQVLMQQTALQGGGEFYRPRNPQELYRDLENAFLTIAARASSGTAASVLASGEGSGANLVQALFYPKRIITTPTATYTVDWAGTLQNFWYYIDPFFKKSTMMEDTFQDGYLNPTNDYSLVLRFDTDLELTMADRYTYGTGTLVDTIVYEKAKSLWEAGSQLWLRNLGVFPRDIYVNAGGGLINFSVANAPALRPYFDLTANDLDPADGYPDGDLNKDNLVTNTDAEILIRYVRGEDFVSTYPWLRSRTVKIGNDPVGRVWKLGDILNSTPKIASSIQLGNYDGVYGDSTYTAYVKSAAYQNRGLAFAGGNDGMLHAFKFGKMTTYPPSTIPAARLTNPDTNAMCNPLDPVPCAHEMWAFIPKNALPYLRYLPDESYCHIYTVDLSPYIFDASIKGAANDTKTVGDWRTVLIGGMRFGGACKKACADADCIKTPATDPFDATKGLGYSSYFALDITDNLADKNSPPVLLWEFSDENLGASSTGPAIVRVGGDKTLNGTWLVVVGSGPTGPIDQDYHQFLSRSNQNLRLFVLDLKTGALLRTIDTGIPNAFAGSMINASTDPDLDYQDNALYIPYVQKASDNTWTDGGIVRLDTYESSDVATWNHSVVIDNVGPVTSAIARLQSKSPEEQWLFFGTGRYYYERGPEIDDGAKQRSLYGVKDKCFTAIKDNQPCSKKASADKNATNDAAIKPEAVADGWWIDLDIDTSANPVLGAERVITDPLATTSGNVFFTSFQPYTDICALGGKSFIWAVKYSTGGTSDLLKGVGLLQVSTGSIEQVELSKRIVEKEGRRTAAIEGVPPTAQGLSLLSAPPPMKKTIHIRER